MRFTNVIRRVLLAALAMCMLLTTAAMADVANFTFTLNSAGTAYTVTGYTGNESTVKVPDWYKSLPVTAIGADAFLNNTTMTKVELPTSITALGDRAFKTCTKLAAVSYYTADSEPPVEVVLPGDVNGDTMVTIHDALRIMQYRAGWSSAAGVKNSDTADVDGNGSVELADAILILRYCAGEIDTLQ